MKLFFLLFVPYNFVRSYSRLIFWEKVSCSILAWMPFLFQKGTYSDFLPALEMAKSFGFRLALHLAEVRCFALIHFSDFSLIEAFKMSFKWQSIIVQEITIFYIFSGFVFRVDLMSWVKWFTSGYGAVNSFVPTFHWQFKTHPFLSCRKTDKYTHKLTFIFLSSFKIYSFSNQVQTQVS